MPWAKELNIKAATYSCLRLFEVKPNTLTTPNPNRLQPGEYADSPSGMWRYVINTLPTGSKLHTWSGSKLGSVLFDGPVCIPTIYSRRSAGWDTDPWMSLTPAEMLSMRTGARLATGHTVIAGLGLGHLLIEVCQKRSVKKVTLVEISRELVDWIFPRIQPYLKCEVDVIIGDANATIPSLEADAALIDIFPFYGNNEFRAKHPCIEKIWVWGSAAIK